MSISKDKSYGLRFENVWSLKNQDLLDEIVEAWAILGVVPEGQSSMDRAKQVVYLVRNTDSKIVGISTTYISFIPKLKNKLFVYRCLIFPKYRYPGLLAMLTKMTLEYLESIHHSLNEKIIGVITEIENKSLQKLNLAVLPSGFVFIGYSKRGNPVRVYYFKGAKI